MEELFLGKKKAGQLLAHSSGLKSPDNGQDDRKQKRSWKVEVWISRKKIWFSLSENLQENLPFLWRCGVLFSGTYHFEVSMTPMLPSLGAILVLALCICKHIFLKLSLFFGGGSCFAVKKMLKLNELKFFISFSMWNSSCHHALLLFYK